MSVMSREGDQNDAPGTAVAARPILVTGFGPFPGVADNPSGRFARSVHGETVGGRPVLGRVLPVEWRRAWPILLEAVEAYRPLALLMYGVATQRDRVEVERIARNRAGPRVDAAGELPRAACIVAEGPAEVATTLPWADLLGPHVGTSDDAGDYLCNYVMYRSVHALCDRVPYCGFIHLPDRETPGARAVLTRLGRLLR